MQAEAMNLNGVNTEALVEVFRRYLEEHPEVVYKIFNSTVILQSLATKEDLRLVMEMLDKRFEAMERANQQRFEVIEKRFEVIEKRLNFIQWFVGIGFTFLVVLITIINFIK